MNIEESKNQIETLIEAWQLDEADLNQTDINAMQVLLKENQELKKQVDKGLYNTCLPYTTGYNKAIKDKETQQKEFIKYLEDEIYNIEPKGTGINYNCEYDSEEDYVRAMQEQSRLNTLKEILQKYKEIIGVLDEKVIN